MNMKPRCSTDRRSEPVYTIGIIGRMLKVCPATLRIWERKGLIKPTRLGKNRFYSAYDLTRLKMIQFLIQEKGLNLEGTKAVLEMKRCWEIRGCTPAERMECPVYRHTARSILRTFSQPGGPSAS